MPCETRKKRANHLQPPHPTPVKMTRAANFPHPLLVEGPWGITVLFCHAMDPVLVLEFVSS